MIWIFGLSNDDINSLRQAVISEQQAVVLYEEIINKTTNNDIKLVLTDMKNEERTHIGELMTLIEMIDLQEKEFLFDGKQKVNELIRKNKSLNLGEQL